MSRSGGKSAKTGRQAGPPLTGRPVAPEEAELWDRVARSVDRVKSKPRVPSHADAAASPPATPVRAVPAPAKPAPRLPPKPPGPPPPEPRASRPPPLVEFERRAVRQVAAGRISIDARLDLHGLRQRDARAELGAFLRAAQARGCRMVLIITGKGDPAAEQDRLAGALGKPQRGVLRRSVPQWLAEPDLRPVVLSYASAGTRHGGDGALYVQLRKRGRA
ncbi:MAG: Smr/MutS family protein [Hyphomonadaceae bacterium]|nr:Smr/MutS family protein [Hyphomonadaceae bacterium]